MASPGRRARGRGGRTWGRAGWDGRCRRGGAGRRMGAAGPWARGDCGGGGRGGFGGPGAAPFLVEALEGGEEVLDRVGRRRGWCAADAVSRRERGRDAAQSGEEGGQEEAQRHHVGFYI